ncbi:MAG: PIN domain-containing protein [Candidatus Hodarchaeota archaeon]
MSEWDRSNWILDNHCERLYNRIQELDKEQKKTRSKENQWRDALIADTCIQKHIPLITSDTAIYEVVKEFGGHVLNFVTFLREPRNFLE